LRPWAVFKPTSALSFVRLPSNSTRAKKTSRATPSSVSVVDTKFFRHDSFFCCSQFLHKFGCTLTVSEYRVAERSSDRRSSLNVSGDGAARFTFCYNDNQRSLNFFGQDRCCNALQGHFQRLGSERFNQMCLKTGTFAFG
jgi:hypothetical protein